MRGTLILGGGPGGTGPLIWAMQNGMLDSWLTEGITIVDSGASLGGTIGRYAVNSDSLGAVYLECLDAPACRDLLAPLRDEPATREIEAMRHAFPPLTVVGRYLRQLGAILEQRIASSPYSEFRSHTKICSLHLREDGSLAAHAMGPDGESCFLEAETAVMALGGRQHVSNYLGAELAAGVTLAGVAPDKLMPSDTLLSIEGLARARVILASGENHRVVIIGGSHSAFSAAWVLTNLLPEIPFGLGEIVILARRHPRIFYASRQDAEADGCMVTDGDICPRTQRVNRLGGLRGDGRDTWRRIARRTGVQAEDRVTARLLSDPEISPTSLRRLLDEAALVVPALGYCAATVPIYDPHGNRLPLMAEYGNAAVGNDARVLLANGKPLRNVFGIGLGAGFRPWGHMGGERNFDGQANSLWLYQNDIGRMVYLGIQECLGEVRRRMRSRSFDQMLRPEAADQPDAIGTEAWPLTLRASKPVALG